MADLSELEWGMIVEAYIARVAVTQSRTWLMEREGTLNELWQESRKWHLWKFLHIESHLQRPVSSKAIWYELLVAQIYSRVAIPKPMVTACKTFIQHNWCHKHRNCTQLWVNVIWSDKLTLKLFQTNRLVYLSRILAEAYYADCFCPTVKHGGGSVMVWGEISHTVALAYLLSCMAM